MSKLNQIMSIINGYANASDRQRVFTYIEFVKMFGYENDINTFITEYKDYVTKWASIKKESITLSDDDYVMSKMVDILKSITLDYSSYEQQDFIAHIDLTNKAHLKALSAFYSRKIREITEFYRKKRNESVTIIRRNSMKGSTKSIQQVIYEKVFDFVFSNRNIVPSYKNIKRDLLISIQNYVDTYSEYFDIPRQKQFTDETRAKMLSANMNDVDYRMYLEIELVISEILFSGNVYLEEIPLVAQLGVDLSQSCVGDMLALKNNLMANTQINQVDLNEQVALKRKLYEKYLGCDLWYMYVDLQGNIKMDILCQAKNPSGNLLNCGSADTATIENEELTLLSHIGLFFKPQKISILKVNAKDYTWTVDTDVIENDTMYVFPDPSRYGDIGNNKQATYPLVMQYKLDYDIRNLSSGVATDDPIKYITDQGWYSYYSKQEDDFKVIDNKDYEYVFTWLANRGFISNYQQDIWGNHFGILKGCNVKYKYDEDGETIIGVEQIQVEEDFVESQMKNDSSQVTGQAILLNGGYFENPLYTGYKYQYQQQKWRDKPDAVPFKGRFEQVQVLDDNGQIVGSKLCFRRLVDQEQTDYQWHSSVRHDVSFDQVSRFPIDANGNSEFYEKYTQKTLKWLYDGQQDLVKPFDFNKRMKLVTASLKGMAGVTEGFYNWTGIGIKNDKFFYNNNDTNFINYGTFNRTQRYKYDDNFMNGLLRHSGMVQDENIIKDVLLDFMSSNQYQNGDIKINKKNSTFDQIHKMSGQCFVKTLSELKSRPKTIEQTFDWIDWEDLGKVIDMFIVKNILMVETQNYFTFIPYEYDGNQITNALGLRQLIKINKKWNSDQQIVLNDIITTKVLFVQGTNKFYITQVQIVTDYERCKSYVLPTIYQFDTNQYKIKEVVNLTDFGYKQQYQSAKLNKEKLFSSMIKKKLQIVQKDNYNKIFDFIYQTQDQQLMNVKDFEIPYYPIQYRMEDIVFSYNSALGTYLMSFILHDSNDTPYIYQYKFKCDNLQYFIGSLRTRVYSIKNEELSYRWNDKLQPTEVSMYPNLQQDIDSIFIPA